MSYFNLSTGAAPETNGSFEIGGGDFEPIPKNTVVRAIAEQVKWDSYNDEPEYISVTWQVQLPEQHKNRKVFQKIKVNEADPQKSDKAIMMLSAILHNAGSNFEALGSGKPTSEKLNQVMTFKPMSLKIGVWEIKKDGETKSGNFVQAVSSVQQAASSGAAPAKQQAADDDLPF